MKRLTDYEVAEAIFDFMLQSGVNFLPQLKEMRAVREFTLIESNCAASGNWLANTITRSGGITYWREHLRLLDEEDYKLKTYKWRCKHGPNPYADID